MPRVYLYFILVYPFPLTDHEKEGIKVEPLQSIWAVYFAVGSYLNQIFEGESGPPPIPKTNITVSPGLSGASAFVNKSQAIV